MAFFKTADGRALEASVAESKQLAASGVKVRCVLHQPLKLLLCLLSSNPHIHIILKKHHADFYVFLLLARGARWYLVFVFVVVVSFVCCLSVLSVVCRQAVPSH